MNPVLPVNATRGPFMGLHAGGIQGPASVPFIIRGGPAATVFALAQQQGGAGLDDPTDPPAVPHAWTPRRATISYGIPLLVSQEVAMADSPKVALGTSTPEFRLPAAGGKTSALTTSPARTAP